MFSLDCSIPGLADTTITPAGDMSCATARLAPATQTLQQPKRARTVSLLALQGIFFGVSLQRLLTRSKQLPLSICSYVLGKHTRWLEGWLRHRARSPRSQSQLCSRPVVGAIPSQFPGPVSCLTLVVTPPAAEGVVRQN